MGPSLPADVPDLGTSSEACWVEHVGESAAAKREASKHVNHMCKDISVAEQQGGASILGTVLHH
jgi:hypothetical protein